MPTPSGMRGDNGATGTGNLRHDSVRDRSVGQTALRRLLSGLPPDSRLTPETRGGRASNSGSVSARGVFSCQKFLFSESNGRRISLSFVPSYRGQRGNWDFCRLEQNERGGIPLSKRVALLTHNVWFRRGLNQWEFHEWFRWRRCGNISG